MSKLRTDNLESLDTGRSIEVDDIASRNDLAGDPADGLGAALVYGAAFRASSVADYMTEAEITDAKKDSPILDHSVLFQTALDACSKALYIPDDFTLRIGGIDVNGKTVYGDGVIVKLETSTYALQLLGDNSRVEGLKFKPEAASGQPNWDIKLGKGAKSPVIANNTFLGGVSYSSIGAAAQQEDPYTESEIVQNAVIKGNTIDGYIRGIMLFENHGTLVHGNTIKNTYFDGLRVNRNTRNISVTNNYFENIGDPSIGADNETRDAIDTAGTTGRLLIANNIIKTAYWAGLDIKGTGSTEVIVIGNLIDSTRLEGIVLTDCGPGTIISNNIITRCLTINADDFGSDAAAGVHIKTYIISDTYKFITISNNTIMYNHGRGIYSQFTVKCKIDNNSVINNSGHGIFISGAFYSVTGNIVVNDPLLENPDRQSTGIKFLFTPEDSGIFADNQVENNTSRQIHLDPDLITNFSSIKGNFEKGVNAYWGDVSTFQRVFREPVIHLTGNGVYPTVTLEEGTQVWTKFPNRISSHVQVNRGDGLFWADTGPIGVDVIGSIVVSGDAGEVVTLVIPSLNVKLGDIVCVSPGEDVGDSWVWSGTAANGEIKIRFTNVSSVTSLAGSIDVRAKVFFQ